MKKPSSVVALDELGRVRLSKTFFMRDFLYSEIGHLHGLSNIPDNPDLAIEAGKSICENLLEPLQDRFGRLAIRSAYRSKEVNGFGNAQQQARKSGYTCASNEKNYGHHIWDERDSDGNLGATVCLVVPSFIPLYENGVSWKELAWWIHDNLPYSSMYFFPKNAAFNLRWCEVPERRIDSYIRPDNGTLTKPGMENNNGDHSHLYPALAKC
jgi:hypothetical protein